MKNYESNSTIYKNSLQQNQRSSFFQTQFEAMLSRQHTKQFHLVDEPNIVYNLSMLRPQSVDCNQKQTCLKSGLKINNLTNSKQFKRQQGQKELLKKNSLPFTRNSFSFFNRNVAERDKYKHIKQKLTFFIKNVENQQNLIFSEILQYKQIILKEFLSSIIQNLKRQCKEKGDLIQFIWNNMFALINKILSALTDKKNLIQKHNLEQTIKEHEDYQNLIQKNKETFNQISQKSQKSQQIISRLIYQLRFKKKQTKKLYSNLYFCIEKLNEFKNSCIQLQTQYIDLLMTTKDISREEAIDLFQKKKQIDKQTQIKIRIPQNKKKIEKQIKEQLAKEDMYLKKQQSLIQDLGDIIKLESSHQKSAFISELLQNYSTINQKVSSNQQVIKIEQRKQKKVSIGTQMDDFYKFSTFLWNESSQTTYSDKIQNQLVCVKATQTIQGKKFVKKYQNKQVQADGDAMRIILIKKKLLIYRTLNLDFYFYRKVDQNIKPSLAIQSNSSNKQPQIKRNVKITQSLIPNLTNQIVQKKKSFLQNSSFKRKIQKQTTNKIQQRKSSLQGIKSVSRKQKSRFKKHQRKQSQDSSNLQFVLNKNKQNPLQQNDLQSQETNFLINHRKLHSMKRHRSSILAQNQNIETIQFNQNKANFIDQNLRNRKKEYFFIEKDEVLKNFKQNLYQKQEKFNRTLPEKQLKEKFQNKIESLNFNGKLKKTQSNLNINKFKSSFNNFSNLNGSYSTSPLIEKTIDKMLKKSFVKMVSNDQNYIQCKEKSNFNSIFDKLNPLIMDVLNMLNNQPEYIKRKHRSNINIKNSYKILMLVYSKAFDLMNRKVILQTLALPLFQTFQLMYGTLKMQDIYKKMIAFIVSMVSVNNNQILKTFSFFFGLQNSGHCCSILTDKITTADTVLFLKLLQKLSLGPKVTIDIQNAYTTISKVNQSLPHILSQQQIPTVVIRQILVFVQRKLQDFKVFVGQGNQKKSQKYEQQVKLNLFKMSKIIVEQIIKLRQNLIKSFEHLFDILLLQDQSAFNNKNCQIKLYQTTNYKSALKQQFKQNKNNQKQKIPIKEVQKIIKCCKLDSNRLFQILKLLQQISLKQPPKKHSQLKLIDYQQMDQNNLTQKSNIKNITKNEFASLMLKLNILNLQQIFKINQEQLKSFKERTKTNIIQQNSFTSFPEFQLTKQKIQQIKAQQNYRKIQFLVKLEYQSSFQLEHLLGQINLIYHLSIFSSIKNKKAKLQQKEKAQKQKP